MATRSAKRRIRADVIRKSPPQRARQPDKIPGYYDGTQRPLQCLAFLLPMIIAYEAGLAIVHHGRAVTDQPDLAAQLLLSWFFSLFGATGYFLPGFALIAVLLCWHAASRQPWKIEPTMLVGMFAESVLLALPLLTMNRLFDAETLAAVSNHSSVGVDLLLSIGAGIYEELVFRLMLISLLMLLLKDIGGMKQTPAVAFAVIISSLAFAAHHYKPIGSEDFATRDFAFRTLAGAYLAGVFVTRGFGIAVGCHAIYDIIVVAML